MWPPSLLPSRPLPSISLQVASSARIQVSWWALDARIDEAFFL
jgi:hypothetical protein